MKITRILCLIACIALGLLTVRALYLEQCIVAFGFCIATIVAALMFVYCKYENP